MGNLHQELPPPSGWPTAWVERELPAQFWYISAVMLLLGSAMIFLQVRNIVNLLRFRRELAANPSTRAAIVKKMNKRLRKTDKGNFKIALAFMANTLLITLVDGFIAMFVLYNDISENSAEWDKEMIIEVAIYCINLLVLFVASFIFVPLLQMLVVTWGLKRFSRKNKLSDYVPAARSLSSTIALTWSAACFAVIVGWPAVGSSRSAQETTIRFVVLEAIWGSALAWLEASFLFNYLGHAIGDKELSRGNGVAEIVSLFAKAAKTPFVKSKSETLPQYEEVAQHEPLLDEKHRS